MAGGFSSSSRYRSGTRPPVRLGPPAAAAGHHHARRAEDPPREENLYDTGRGASSSSRTAGGRPGPPDPTGASTTWPSRRWGWSAHAWPQRAARAYPPRAAGAARSEPARWVSQELLTREEFVPATIVNVLAAARPSSRCTTGSATGKTTEKPWELELAEDDLWEERPMRDPAHAARPRLRGRGRRSDVRHRRLALVDGSQIYGSEPALSAALRTGEAASSASTRTSSFRDLDEKIDLTGVAGNFWLGLALLHTLFMLEHNAICDRSRPGEPGLGGRQALRHRAARQLGADGEDPHGRVDAGIIAHPTTVGMRANWSASSASGSGRFSKGEVLSGIPARRRTITACRTR